MVEIVFCRVTRRGRKKGKGMNKGLRGNMRNDGPAMSFVPPDDTIKITLDLRSATNLVDTYFRNTFSVLTSYMPGGQTISPQVGND